jgi:hypothetical protein
VDFSNETYVRLYTRDTATWLRWKWQARTLFVMLLRKVDRHGVLDLDGGGAETLAALVSLPFEVVEAGLPDLTRPDRQGRRTVEFSEDRIGIPNFVEAQEAKASDAKRCRDYRDRMKGQRGRNANTPRVETDTLSGGATRATDDATRTDRTTLETDTLSTLSLSQSTHTAAARANSNEHATSQHPRPDPLPAETAQEAIKRHGEVASLPGDASTPKRLPWPGQTPGSDPLTADLWAELKRHEALTEVATWKLAEQLAGAAMTNGKQAAWLKTAIADAARDVGAEQASGHPPLAPQVAKTVARYCARAEAPRANGARYPQRNPDPPTKHRPSL